MKKQSSDNFFSNKNVRNFWKKVLTKKAQVFDHTTDRQPAIACLKLSIYKYITIHLEMKYLE